MELTPEKKQFLRILGYFFLQSGKYDRAFSVLKGLKSFFPKDVEIAASYGFCAVHVGQYEIALAEADFILAQADSGSQVKGQGLYIKSNALWGLNQKERATVAFDELINGNR